MVNLMHDEVLIISAIQHA